jgi:hypothetical protein
MVVGLYWGTRSRLMGLDNWCRGCIQDPDLKLDGLEDPGRDRQGEDAEFYWKGHSGMIRWIMWGSSVSGPAVSV